MEINVNYRIKKYVILALAPLLFLNVSLNIRRVDATNSKYDRFFQKCDIKMK